MTYVFLQPPIVVLSVVVIEADGLEAKDVNGKISVRFRRISNYFLNYVSD